MKLKLNQLDLSNKSKLYLVRNPKTFAGQPIVRIAEISGNGKVAFLGEERTYIEDDIDILSAGIPLSWIVYILYLLRRR